MEDWVWGGRWAYQQPQQISTENQLRTPYHTGQQQRLEQKQPYSNTTKYWKNWNYCWTCGYDVPNWCTSATCPIPRKGHVYYATCENPCNGSNKARHRFNMWWGGAECRNNSEKINTNVVTLYQLLTHTQSHAALQAIKDNPRENHNYYAILDSGTADTI